MKESLTELQRKKKTRFPISRIRKLIQQNEDIGKTTATVPVVLSKSIELFLVDLLEKTAKQAEKSGSSKITATHIERVIEEEGELYKFLVGVVKEPED